MKSSTARRPSLDASRPLGRGELASPAPDLSAVRAEIDRLDEALLDLIARRVRIARSAGRAKSARGWPIRDTAREARVVRRAAAGARDRGVDPEPVRDVFWRLIALAAGAQEHA
jgi:chorismate mutase